MASNKMTVTVGITKDIIEVCHQLMQERDNLQTHLDLSAQAIDAVTAERDEARAWARRMKRERDEASKELDEIKNKFTYTYRFFWTFENPGRWWGLHD